MSNRAYSLKLECLKKKNKNKNKNEDFQFNGLF